MFPAASFFALKTHFDPTIFTPSGASTTSHVPAAFNVASSSSIAFSHSGQSGRLWASFKLRGSRASALLVSATNAYSSAHFSALAVQSGLGCCIPGADGALLLVDHDPWPPNRSAIFFEGLRTRLALVSASLLSGASEAGSESTAGMLMTGAGFSGTGGKLASVLTMTSSSSTTRDANGLLK